MVLHRICVAINRHVIVQINSWFYVMFWNRDGYVMATVHATRRPRDKIHDVLRRDNIIVKTNVNLINKNHLLGGDIPFYL